MRIRLSKCLKRGGSTYDVVRQHNGMSFPIVATWVEQIISFRDSARYEWGAGEQAHQAKQEVVAVEEFSDGHVDDLRVRLVNGCHDAPLLVVVGVELPVRPCCTPAE
eukprot:6197536-Pleurochrysis_carterae.AAC.12